MWLPRRIRDLLGSLEAAQKLADDVGELRAAVAALEALQLDREVQWVETKDQLMRHLKRVQALKQHGSAKDDRSDLVAAILAKKFPAQRGE